VKLTSVLVQLKAPLRFLPPDAIHALHGVVFNWMEGADAQHTARWTRMWRRLYHSPSRNPSLQLWLEVDRDRPFHARWMSVEDRLFASQEPFVTRNGMRLWLKTGAAFGRYEAQPGGMVFVPSSLNWEDCSDDEMREFTEDATAFLATPHALEYLWPQVRETHRIDMLEACLNPPTETTE
jgi:hypothetical protein